MNNNLLFINDIKEKYDIIFLKDISEYYSSPVEQIYEDLTSIKKDYYKNNERIIFYDPTIGVIDYYDLINKQLIDLDIPDFFIFVITDNNFKSRILHNPESDIMRVGFKKELNFHKKKISVPENLCVNPWINIEINQSGRLNFCCNYRTKSPYYKISNKTMKNFYETDFVKDVKNLFLNNDIPSGCSKCFDIESKNGKSKRLNDNYVFREKKYRIDWFNDQFEKNVVSLDLKIGNLCNLACRICNEDYSSLWATENEKVLNVTNEKWFNSDDGLNSILDLDLEYLQITGGEPLLDKSHVKLLKKLNDTKKSSKINLHYNTNGTVYPIHLLDIWKEFKTVQLSLSIDNLYDKFNYERWGLIKWDAVKDNIDKLSDLDNIKVDVYTSVTIFNILDLGEICNYFEKRRMDVSFNLVSFPSMYNILWLPDSIKDYITKKFEIYKNEKYYEKIKSIVEYLNSNKIEDQTKEFFSTTKDLDMKRKQSFEKTYSEMHYLLTKGN